MLKLGTHKAFKGKRLYKEVWKDIKEFEGFYQISNLGRVRSLDREVKRSEEIMKVKGKIIKAHLNTKGYKVVDLYKDGKRKHKHVHYLIAKAFIPNPDNKSFIDHIDTNKTNNNISNLRWCTHKENMNNEITLKKQKESQKGKKLSEETKRKIGEAFRGRKLSEEAKRKLSLANKGKKMPEHVKRKLIESHKGKKIPEETKRKMRNSSPNKKRVLCIETGIIYVSVMEAGRQTNIHASSITNCCNGKRKSAGKLHWRYI